MVLPINLQYVFDLFLLYFFRSHDAIIFLDASYASDEMVGNRDVRNCVDQEKGEEMCSERIGMKKRREFPRGVVPFPPSSAV